MATPRLQDAINDAIASFTEELIAIILQATVEELAGVLPEPTREPPAAPEAIEDADAGKGQDEEPKPVSRAPAAPGEKTHKTRTWPTCSAPGCTSKMYGPSGGKRLCYQHHLEAGFVFGAQDAQMAAG